MSLCFPYMPLRTAAPIWTLAGRQDRPKPLITVAIVGPTRTRAMDALLDTGADDSVFPESMATKIGLDLTNAPSGESCGVGGARIPLRYAHIRLRLTGGREFRDWPARVAFAPIPMVWGLLGFAGCLQFFDACFFGSREEVELTVNHLYPGT
jgi:hypothetical protein